MASKAQTRKRLQEQRKKAQQQEAAAREQRAFELRVGVNAQRRKQTAAEWRSEYAGKLREGIQPLSEVARDSIGGVAAQRSVMDTRWKRTYSDDPEMAAREAQAQELIEQRNRRVAPAFSKGAYQLITDVNDFRTAGRKV